MLSNVIVQVYENFIQSSHYSIVTVDFWRVANTSGAQFYSLTTVTGEATNWD